MIARMTNSTFLPTIVIALTNRCTNRAMKVSALRAFISPHHLIELLLANRTRCFALHIFFHILCINNVIFILIILAIIIVVVVTHSHQYFAITNHRIAICSVTAPLNIIILVGIAMQTRHGTRDRECSLLDDRHQISNIGGRIIIFFVLAEKRFTRDLLHIFTNLVHIAIHGLVLRLKFAAFILVLAYNLSQRICHCRHGHILLRHLRHFMLEIIDTQRQLLLFVLLSFAMIFLIKCLQLLAIHRHLLLHHITL
mmetsp:Transcript_39628/g.64819  ORF Transcript_39628/g.64819 Transcript_39628/m.64819 type:complete len:254 (-) Transcript_39628:1033-1794(-)